MKISRGKFKFLSVGMKTSGMGGWGRNEQKRGREELREYTLGVEERNAGGGRGRNRFVDQARWFERLTAAVASEETAAQVRRGKWLQEKKQVTKGKEGGNWQRGDIKRGQRGGEGEKGRPRGRGW